MAEGRRKRSLEGSPIQFKQDIIGILLLAIAIFILFSNLSSGTGPIGLILVKTFLKDILGVGVYVLPLFIALLGITVMIRQELPEFTARLIGLLLLFLTLIAFAQIYSPNYFSSRAGLFSGAGGLVGYGLKIALERTVGPLGAYIVLSAFGAISVLMVLNVTFITLISKLGQLVFKRRSKRLNRTLLNEDDKSSIPAMIPVLKEMPTKKEDEIEVEVPTAKRISKYKLPPLDLLDLRTEREKKKEEQLRETTEGRRERLEEVLRSFGVAATVVNINQGPAVTRFELQPEPGVKVSRIFSLSDDIALNMAAQGVRIEAPIPGKSVIGIEVPNAAVTPVRLGEIVRTVEFQRNPSKLFIALGEDLSGTPIFGDLTQMPHLLIAGTTGSGKSVCINSLIISILLKAKPDEVKFMMIDPKMVELTNYDGIPHLLAPVVTDARKAALTLKEWVMREMDRRYKEFFAAGVRNIEAYNERVYGQFERLPYIVVIVDELADLMMVAAAEVETSICRIAQMARATGIHLVIATQRPSVDVITGLIKANIPSRISFAVATQVDSRVILDMGGAEKLLGRGDMLYHPVGSMKPIRLQGSFVGDQEIERLVSFIKKQAAPEYSQEIIDLKPISEVRIGEGERDELFAEAAKIIVEGGQASTSHLQRRLRIGYNRAARLMDELEAAQIVSKFEGENKPRRILATRETLKRMGIE